SRIPSSSRAACGLYSRAATIGVYPSEEPMSRAMFRTLLGAMAASLLIAAAGACTRDNPSNPSRGGTGGNGNNSGTPSAPGNPTAGNPNPNGQIPAPPCNVDTDCTSGLICVVGRCNAPCGDTNPCGNGQTCTNGRCYTGTACGTST